METAPKFRVDLVEYDQASSGSRSNVILRDPLTDKYYRLSRYEFDLLSELDGRITIEQAVEKQKTAGQYYAIKDAQAIVAKAAQLGLVLGTRYGTAAMQRDLKQRMKAAKRAKYLSSVYFLFIPVWNPDRFLERTVWFFRLIANRWTGYVAAIATTIALYLVIAGLPRIRLEFLFFFNLENLLFLWVTIALTKIIHEFAHAYTAKSFGLRVPDMGIAFLIFFPCLYCNTTDAWQLADRRQRIAISAAGILAEAVLAVISTFVWYFSKPGLLNSLSFYLMAVSLGSTVLFNANPLMRFDGYFMLIDFLKMPNLATNSLRHVKYLFLNRVLGNDTVTTPARDESDGFTFTTYGIAAFLYRVFLYVSIAIGVYYRFDKTLGIVLAVLAVGLFVIRPVYMGAMTLFRTRRQLQPRWNGVAVFAAIIFVTCVLVCTPWSSKSVYPCFVASRKVQKLTVPLHTMVKEVSVRDGDPVKAGDVLFRLDPSLLNLKLYQKSIERDLIEREIRFLLLKDDSLAKADPKHVQLRQADADMHLLHDKLRLAQDSIVAPFDGVVTGLDVRLQEGFMPGEGSVVGELQSLSEEVVYGLVPATDIHKVRKGAEVELWFPVREGRIIKGKIDLIKAYSEVDLKNSPFSSRVGGELATEVRGKHAQDAPLEAQYACAVFLADESQPLPIGITGRMAMTSPPRSLLTRVRENLWRTFNRESLL